MEGSGRVTSNAGVSCHETRTVGPGTHPAPGSWRPLTIILSFVELGCTIQGKAEMGAKDGEGTRVRAGGTKVAGRLHAQVGVGSSGRQRAQWGLAWLPLNLSRSQGLAKMQKPKVESRSTETGKGTGRGTEWGPGSIPPDPAGQGPSLSLPAPSKALGGHKGEREAGTRGEPPASAGVRGAESGPQPPGRGGACTGGQGWKGELAWVRMPARPLRGHL